MSLNNPKFLEVRQVIERIAGELFLLEWIEL